MQSGCATELLRRQFAHLDIQEVLAPRAYTFDRPEYFEILCVPRDELERHATVVAELARSERFAHAENRCGSDDQGSR